MEATSKESLEPNLGEEEGIRSSSAIELNAGAGANQIQIQQKIQFNLSNTNENATTRRERFLKKGGLTNVNFR